MRVLLQTWGTEFRRAQSPGYWVTREAATLPKSGRFVYTDVRFPNEESFIRRLGSLYRVSRGGVEGNGHVSEAFYRQFPVAAEIRNDGTLEELRAAVLSTITLAGVAA